MDVPAETAQAVADKARELGRACSAVYVTLTAKVAAARWAERPDLWLVGLGCVAIAGVHVARLAGRTEPTIRHGFPAGAVRARRLGCLAGRGRGDGLRVVHVAPGRPTEPQRSASNGSHTKVSPTPAGRLG
jgi:hypothetical protein